MFDRLKKLILHYLIQLHLRKRNRVVKAVNLNKASSIGILFTISDEANYKIINEIIHKLSGICKEVKALGYIPLKSTPNYMQINLKTDTYLKSDLNLIGLPGQKFYATFTETKFDLLIDLSMGSEDSLKYIATLSKASFKAGYYVQQQVSIFDFMIKDGSTMDFKKYSENILNYLSIINMKAI